MTFYLLEVLACMQALRLSYPPLAFVRCRYAGFTCFIIDANNNQRPERFPEFDIRC